MQTMIPHASAKLQRLRKERKHQFTNSHCNGEFLLSYYHFDLQKRKISTSVPWFRKNIYLFLHPLRYHLIVEVVVLPELAVSRNRKKLQITQVSASTSQPMKGWMLAGPNLLGEYSGGDKVGSAHLIFRLHPCILIWSYPQ